MLVKCPNCNASFSVPDKAIGLTGRTLKCARCEHKWFQHPVSEPPPMSAPRPAPPPPPPKEPDEELASMIAAIEKGASSSEKGGLSSFMGDDDLTDELDPPPLPPKSAVKGAKKTDGKAKRGKRRGAGTFALWFLGFVFILALIGGAGYVFQDEVINHWPPAEEYLIQANLRHAKPGAGLTLTRMGEIERVVHDNVNTVVIRGIIKNISEHSIVIPMMKLVMKDKDNHPVQEKTDKPPVASLDPGASASFVIRLDHPDAYARSIELQFVETPEMPMVPAEPPPAEGTPAGLEAAPQQAPENPAK